MLLEIKIPTPGESITEVEIGRWLIEDGSMVEKDQEVAEIESDKATLTLIAEDSGEITFKVAEGDTVEVGSIACVIDTSKQVAISEEKETTKPTEPEVIEESKENPHVKVTGVAQQMMEEHDLSIDDILNGLKRIGKKEVETVLQQPSTPEPKTPTQETLSSREEKREKMTMLRKKLSQRLVAVKNETAMLTTFNEIDMSNVMALRKNYQNRFIEQHGFKLGFMSFFTKAVAIALKAHPKVNSMIDGDEIVSPNYADVGIAVQTPKGLMVPIVRNAESKSIAQIEREIKELAEKARNKKISVEELTGGTFTITNGGVFGSLLSTPIINPPQSGILGMHNIVERPIAVNGQVEIRPMMYIALSYDHRIIDGKDSVGFLVKVKELTENPEQLLYGGNPIEQLLDI
ncbi:2-oxoglutarate dehydrogenase complex dihydrolipoyllysine-residue succinyltransferase [Prolixibacteraceae bacterium JC049]|nr:2-oxoglutarate dehydrogenase complex dihydrolipoyllysine-residue succinyltransferase [Prolixibacteraceae bacterium JC049]